MVDPWGVIHDAPRMLPPRIAPRVYASRCQAFYGSARRRPSTERRCP